MINELTINFDSPSELGQIYKALSTALNLVFHHLQTKAKYAIAFNNTPPTHIKNQHLIHQPHPQQ